MKDEALKLALEALEFDGFTPDDATHRHYTIKAITAIKAAMAQPEQERNFCPRCGKRTFDLETIHTCTPPQENT